MVGPRVRREAVDVLRQERGYGITRACGLVGISRSLYGYRSRRPAPEGLVTRIRELAEQKRRYGYRRKRKRHVLGERRPLPKPDAANVSWSMDFVADGLADGRKLRCLVIVDDCTRECLAIEVATSLTGRRVVSALQRHHGGPW